MKVLGHRVFCNQCEFAAQRMIETRYLIFDTDAEQHEIRNPGHVVTYQRYEWNGKSGDWARVERMKWSVRELKARGALGPAGRIGI